MKNELPREVVSRAAGPKPVAFGLMPGNVADINMVVPSLEAVAPLKRVVADKAYDADRLRRWLRAPRHRRDSVHGQQTQTVPT